MNVSVVEVVVAISEVAIGAGLPDRACDVLDTLVVAPTIVSFICLSFSFIFFLRACFCLMLLSARCS